MSLTPHARKKISFLLLYSYSWNLEGIIPSPSSSFSYFLHSPSQSLQVTLTKTHSLVPKLGLKVGFLDFLVTRIDMTDWSLWFFSLIWYYLMFYDWFRLSKHGNSWSGWRSWVKSQEKGWIRWFRLRNTTGSVLQTCTDSSTDLSTRQDQFSLKLDI